MPAASQLLGKLRAGFASSGQTAVSPRTTPVISSPVVPTSVQSQLDVLDDVLTEIEAQAPLASVASAVPLAVAQSTDTLNTFPAAGSASTAKEAPQLATAAETAVNQSIDLGGGYQMTEVEHSSEELPPEVDGYLQQVQDHAEQLPQEIVVAGDDIQLIPQAPPLKKVVVLPITPAVEQAGARKGAKFSVRWLVEWSRRLMKMFSGKIIYSQENAT